jgi:hypothetical protein
VPNTTPPEPTAEQEEIIAEEVGAEPETIDLPPNMLKGVTLFELEDGSVGFLPTTAETTMMDAYALCMRIALGIQIDLQAKKMMEMEQQQIQRMQTEAMEMRKKAQQRGRLTLPGRG